MKIGYADRQTSMRVSVFSIVELRSTEWVSRGNLDHTPNLAGHGSDD
jgi:hypothetical protein